MFYCLSHCALWRKPDGKLYPAYTYFSWLSSRKCNITDVKTSWRTARCSHCKKELRTITEGISVSGDTPRFPANTPVSVRAKKLGITTKGKPICKIQGEIKDHVLNNGHFACSINEKAFKLGNPVKFQVVAIAYEIKEPEKLRSAVKKVTTQRGLDLRLKIENLKQELKVGGEYG